ncbi:tRNA pseudouridine(55) synthase TruB [Fusobacterium sp. PH5-44]|uniref:tRNA pseudouridine(55) synthase TruB n=1 Tax=unclassified Fusobacterium TaxID=2648384 RepID=UPI003D19D333
MDGIIIINKPLGITSFDVVRKLRKILRERKIGHTGTLDPLATGVLVMCLGRATKLAQSIENLHKKYIASFQLGYQTDTYDREGKIINKSKKKSVNMAELEECIKGFCGKIKQMPPMYSAIKKDGQRLYELARKGIEVEREAREIEIKSIKVLFMEKNNISIECDVSKGTYIRSLVNDIGIKLGTYATLTDLKRISVGEIPIERSYSLEEIENLTEKKDYVFLENVEDFFDYKKFNILSEKDYSLFKNGNSIKIKEKIEYGIYKIYFTDRFIGFGAIENDILKGYKYF